MTNIDLTDKTQEFYNKAATAYVARNFHRIRVEVLERFLDMLPGKDRVLDIGCSMGRDMMWLKAHGVKKVYGVDFAKGMIELAKKYVEGEFQIADVTKGLSYADDFFDGVLCLGTLGNIPKDKAHDVVNEIYRVLKPKGVVVFTVKEGDREYLEVTNKYGAEYMNLPRRMSLYYQADLKRLMQKAGLQVKEVKTFSDDNYTWVVGYGVKISSKFKVKS